MAKPTAEEWERAALEMLPYYEQQAAENAAERMATDWERTARELAQVCEAQEAEIERLRARVAEKDADAALGAMVRLNVVAHGDVVRLERRALDYRATVFSSRFLAPPDDSGPTPRDALQSALAQPVAISDADLQGALRAAGLGGNDA